MVESACGASAGVFLDDWSELGGAGAVEDDSVAAEVELASDFLDALGGGAGGSGGEPFVRDELGDVLQLLGGGHLVDGALEVGHQIVGQEAF